MTIFITVLSGVIVFVLGQAILKLFVEPWQMQRECIAKISNSLLMYANVYSNPGIGETEEARLVSTETRKLAAELIASCHRIPFYEKLTKTKIFPSIKIIKIVQKNLIGLSNSVHKGNPSINYDRTENIKELLNIKFS